MTPESTAVPSTARTAPAPVTAGHREGTSQCLIYVFSAVPALALAAAVPFAWGWGLSFTDLILAAVFYLVSCLGVTVGFHRLFTRSPTVRSARTAP